MRLADSLGIDPFSSGKSAASPVTFGEFVRLYEKLRATEEPPFGRCGGGALGSTTGASASSSSSAGLVEPSVDPVGDVVLSVLAIGAQQACEPDVAVVDAKLVALADHLAAGTEPATRRPAVTAAAISSSTPGFTIAISLEQAAHRHLGRASR